MADKLDEITKGVAELTVLSFRKVEELKRLAKHFDYVANHPLTEKKPTISKYLKSLGETHKRIYSQKRDYVEVEYILTTEKKSSLQRQRFNSLPVSEVPELLKSEFISMENAKQVHICTDCNVEIDINDEEPLMESLQKHFSLEVHLPKLKRESIDVAEPVILPNMSRRLSAMECGETPAQNLEPLIINLKSTEKLDRSFISKLTSTLMKILPDNSEASIGVAIKFYQEAYEILCQDISNVDFSTHTNSVAPIIMSIKDNVYNNFPTDANKNTDNDENEQTEKPKMQAKKYRFYGPIEALILKLLTHHKLLSLIDDRTGKLAFFCIACEYYTLRFHYDSVLSHVFSDIHIHNLSTILQSDKYIPFSMNETTIERIKEMNEKFLINHDIVRSSRGLDCRLCRTTIESTEATILHLLDERHLAKLSDEMYLRMKASSPDGQIPEEWGPKDLSWIKHLMSVGKPVNNRDHVIIENFIKPSGKIGNFCKCCEMNLKGPRQVLFNHIRQKKHLRNAAPKKLAILYKNHCRPSEYFASFGNFYVCAICPDYVALPSFSAIVEHTESSTHIETISKLIRSALYPDMDDELVILNEIMTDALKCNICDQTFQSVKDTFKHVLSSVDHQTAVAEAKTTTNKGDLISVYMKGNFVLHSEGTAFTCVSCNEVFNSIRSLLMHLVYADHYVNRPSTESVFRFYLELKHNIIMLGRNKYVYYDFGKLKCGVCDSDVEVGENAKRHVLSPRHRENMGASYVNLDASATE